MFHSFGQSVESVRRFRGNTILTIIFYFVLMSYFSIEQATKFPRRILWAIENNTYETVRLLFLNSSEELFSDKMQVM